MLFRASAQTVAVMALDGSLFLHLTDQFVHMHGYRPGDSEVRSWERSIPVLAAALNDAGLGDASRSRASTASPTTTSAAGVLRPRPVVVAQQRSRSQE